MFDVLKKSLLAGIGVVCMTADKVEELAKKIVQESNVPEAEGKKFVEEMLKRSNDARTSIEKMVHDSVTAVMSKIDVPRRADVEELKRKIAELEKKLSARG
jgi:polyhydroxyalkanoate synthesis regulator phasin